MERKINKNNLADILELTPFQEGLLLHYLQNRNRQYTEQLYLRLAGEIDIEFFEKVWQNIVDSNEVLRSFFRWKAIKKPVIIVLKKHQPNIEFLDLSEYSANEIARKVEEIRDNDINQEFDLSEVPFRIKLIKLGEASHIMLISNHHILYDGWSTGIILKEFFHQFESLSAESEFQTKTRKARYKDYVIWNQHRKKDEEAEYWKNYLANNSDITRIPFANPNRNRLVLNDKEKRTHVFDIEPSLYEGIKRYSKNHKLTIANILYSTWSLLLGKFNEEPVVFGTTVSCRPQYMVGVENTVGLFINTIPMVCDIKPDVELKQILQENQAALNERKPYEASSITDIYEYVKIKESSLFDSIVVIENYPIDKILSENSGNLQLIEHHMDYLTHYLLSVVISTFDGIHVTFTYNNQIFSEKALEIIEGYFIKILTEIVSNPDQKFSDLSLVSEKELNIRLEIPFDLKTFKVQKTVCEYFEQQVAISPDNIALQEGELVVSYKELDEKSNGLSKRLIDEGVQPKDVVVLYHHPSVELVIGMLAALKCNATFLPLAPGTPATRLNYILRDSGAKLICTHPSFEEELKKSGGFPKLLPVTFGGIDAVSKVPGRYGAKNDLSYIIYTSGTSGEPKGVMIEDASLANYVDIAIKTYIQDDDVSFPLFTSPAFDLTLTSIFAPLLSGNKIVVYHADQKDFLIEKIFEDNEVNIVKLTPSHLKLLKEKARDQSAQLSSGIKRFIVGGELLTTELAKEIHTIYEGAVEIYNEYGPTEATIGCMVHRYQHDKDNSLAVPIGKATDNNWIYVLDKNLSPVPSGVIGEMYIAGLGLARGYINNEDLTKEKFIANPFVPNERIYKTGDIARWLPDGNLEYIGRNDKQVKVRGYRIELEEIEKAILQYGSPKDSFEHFDIIASTKKLGDLKRCNKCLLPENYPSISFDEEGVCNICNEFAEYKQQIDEYFKTEDDFLPLAKAMKNRNEAYDCLLLYSGGKDSTYVLHKLIDYGLEVLTYTFDNGYISETAFKNIETTTKKLDVKHIKVSSKNMHKVFSESLRSNCSACHGCWHAINTFGIQIAKRNNIKHIISGLSRGQIYDMRLEGIFETRVFEENRIEEQLDVFRRSFHSGENKYSKLLKVSLNHDTMEGMQFVDFFRYHNTPTRDIKSYLLNKGWIQPKDTGFCSSNCLINDVGIYTHIKEKGYNFYTAPISWDVRLGQSSRQEGIEEVTAFGSTEDHVQTILKEIKYSRSIIIKEAIVTKSVKGDKESLVAYVVSDLPPNISELRTYLKKQLPEYMIPSYFIQIDQIPLTANGKLDMEALPKIAQNRPRLKSGYILPGTAFEQKVAQICKEVLSLEIIGANDNLFDLGATSFDLTRIASKLNQAFDKKIGVTSLFTYTTIRDLAAYFGEQKAQDSRTEEKTARKFASKLGQRRKLLNKN